MNILLVDDEAELVSALAERLTLRGFTVSCATGGEAAVDLARSTPFDLAVLDVKMPGLGGIELREKLQRIRPGLRFIFVTGHGSEEDFRAGSAGAASYLVKPVRIDDLVASIHAAMKG